MLMRVPSALLTGVVAFIVLTMLAVCIATALNVVANWVPRPLQLRNWHVVVILIALVIASVPVALGIQALTNNSSANPPIVKPTTSPQSQTTQVPGILVRASYLAKTPVERVDWAGHVLGPMTLVGADAGSKVSPDGLHIVVWMNDGAIRIVNIYGPAASYDNPDGVWAEDSRHLCSVDRSGNSIGWATLAPGSTRTTWLPITGEPHPSGDVFPVGCSAANHTIAVGANNATGYGLAYIDIIDTLTGHILFHREFPWNTLGNPMLSPNGQYIVIDNWNNDKSMLMRASDGAIVLTNIQGRPIAFSGDSQRLIVTTGQSTFTQATSWSSSVIAVPTGGTIWSTRGKLIAYGRGRPDGDDFALQVSRPEGGYDVEILHADGTEIPIATRGDPVLG